MKKMTVLALELLLVAAPTVFAATKGAPAQAPKRDTDAIVPCRPWIDANCLKKKPKPGPVVSPMVINGRF
jgi:hypothetical protein